jgi:hypothetical protein
MSIDDVLAQMTEMLAIMQNTSSQVESIVAKVDPVLSKMSKIEDLIFAVLIIIAVVILIWFVVWLFRHIYPIVRGWHSHPHTFDNFIRDITEIPIRQTCCPTSPPSSFSALAPGFGRLEFCLAGETDPMYRRRTDSSQTKAPQMTSFWEVSPLAICKKSGITRTQRITTRPLRHANGHLEVSHLIKTFPGINPH